MKLGKLTEGNPTTLANGQPGSQWGNRILFTGREYLSDMRIYDFRNRVYHPELGRFLQPDPIQFKAGDYNLYRYCHNDPVNHSDPDGLQVRRNIPTPTPVRQQRKEAMQGGRLPQRAPGNISGNRYLPDGRVVPPQIRAAPTVRQPTLGQRIGDFFRRLLGGGGEPTVYRVWGGMERHLTADHGHRLTHERFLTIGMLLVCLSKTQDVS